MQTPITFCTTWYLNDHVSIKSDLDIGCEAKGGFTLGSNTKETSTLSDPFGPNVGFEPQLIYSKVPVQDMEKNEATLM